MANLILVINPGSTSTKVALYEGENELCAESLEHSAAELANFNDINDQMDFRKSAVELFLKKNGKTPKDLDGIAARGGSVAELETGAYRIDDYFVDLAMMTPNPHPANLAISIAHELEKEGGAPAYAYDLVCGTGKPEEKYTVTGVPGTKRDFLTHVLNSRAVAFAQAKKDHTNINENTYLVSHLGGGISTNLIVNGTILDVVGDDEGTFSPERSGGIPLRKLVRLCYSGKYTEREVQKILKGKGGLTGYLGTGDMRDVTKMMNEGNKHAIVIFDAMVLQLAKDIGSMAAVVNGKVDKIILTGGIAYNTNFTDAVTEKIKWIAPVVVIPGAFEMDALANGINRVLNNEEKARVYDGPRLA